MSDIVTLDMDTPSVRYLCCALDMGYTKNEFYLFRED